VLVILLFAFIEVGRVLYLNNQLNKAIAAGARYVARVPNAVTAVPHCAEGAQWSSATATGTNIIAYTDGGTGPLLLPGLDEGSAITFTPSTRVAAPVVACVVTVTATTQFQGLFGDSVVPFLSLGPLYLKASVEERYIGE
jgi:Flp pilus assembly protein TadG